MNRSLDKIGYIPGGIPYKESKSVEKKNKYFLGLHTQNVERKRIFARGMICEILKLRYKLYLCFKIFLLIPSFVKNTVKYPFAFYVLSV